MYKDYPNLKALDPEIDKIIELEQNRQESHIELIASENYVSPSVLAVQGSILTNKYAEGYPGKRYYGGCEYVDMAEELAIERAKKLFKASYANVQPHSGSQANAAAYMALIKPGETILGMSLINGGHLTHGASVSFSGKIYQASFYGVDSKTGFIDYNRVADIAKQCLPKIIIAGFSAYARTVDWQKFREIADSVGAFLVVDMAHIAGLIAADLHPSPIPIADIITSTTHKTLRGPRGGLILTNNETLAKKINSAIFPGLQGGPLMHVIAAKAVAFKEAAQPQFKAYQKQILSNAKTMSKIMMDRGYSIVSKGTDTHLFLVSLIDKNISGKDAESALGKANIVVNKNSVPNEPRSPFVTSGIRIGTPAITTRGFKESEVTEVANWVCDILDDLDNQSLIEQVKEKVRHLNKKFPVYS